jgi:hypothetical protein
MNFNGLGSSVFNLLIEMLHLVKVFYVESILLITVCLNPIREFQRYEGVKVFRFNAHLPGVPILSCEEAAQLAYGTSVALLHMK